jgi:RNase H-fold protein (predicted Holliday junction resolvase)
MQEQKIRDRQKKHLEHQISATLILQSYLDHRRLERNVPPHS